MIIRKATKEDINSIIKIFDNASKFIASYGSDQWQGYSKPSEKSVIRDMQNETAYVLVDDDAVIGYMSLSFDKDTNYDKIKNGRWESNYDYGVIHRLSLDDSARGKGLSKVLFDFAEQECINKNIRSIRIDTHSLNVPMKSILKNRKYKKCGIVTIPPDLQREAYEKILIPFIVGDIIQLKKSHPCGNDVFKILRIGMDFRLECEKCKSQIWLSRTDVNRRLKKRL